MQGSYQALYFKHSPVSSHACSHFLKLSLYLDVFPPIALLLALILSKGKFSNFN